MWPNLVETSDFVTFTKEILNGKLIFCAMFELQFAFSSLHYTRMFLQLPVKTREFFKKSIKYNARMLWWLKVLHQGLHQHIFIKSSTKAFFSQFCQALVGSLPELETMAAQLWDQPQSNGLLSFNRKKVKNLILRVMFTLYQTLRLKKSPIIPEIWRTPFWANLKKLSKFEKL